MALFKTQSAAVYGIDAHRDHVEVDMYSQGSPRDSRMVGMPDVAVRESRERIKSALINSGFGYPNKTLTINLAPASVRKEGGGFDLPVALGILGAMGIVKGLDQHILAGEVLLYGAIRPIRGALSIAVCARAEGIPNLILPAGTVRMKMRQPSSILASALGHKCARLPVIDQVHTASDVSHHFNDLRAS